MSKKRFIIPSYIYFILVTVIIILLFPREGKFRYSFSENRPWNYGLLTASFDFPIYKSSSEIAREQDSISKSIKPYYRIDTDVFQVQSDRIDGFAENDDTFTSVFKESVKRTLGKIYEDGVVSDADYQTLMNNGELEIMIINEQGVARPVSLNNVYTKASANSELLKNIPFGRDMSFEIQANLIPDSNFTEKVRQEELMKVSPSVGVVQAGEKIIDRGEIVTPKIYVILNSLKQIYFKEGGTSYQRLVALSGVILLVAGLMACFLMYLISFRKNIYNAQRDVLCILTLVTFFILLTEVAVGYRLFNVYIIPYAIIPIVIRTFFDSRTAQMAHLTVIGICALIVSAPFEFFLSQIIVAMVSIYVLKDLTQRSELVKCAFYILATYVLVYLGYFMYQDGDFTKINWNMFIYFGINFIFVMFAYSLIFIIEKVFGYISNVTLVELSDINRPALKALSESSPGTFQHSLQVSMLATAAASKVGANPQLIRTGALYHDLGKIENPAYFTENRMGGNSPHDTLSLEQSAKIITKHVPDGVKLAEKYNIPPALIKFIQTHHGKGKAKYFYNSYKNQHPGESIDESVFSYEGMNPDTKETAILMMADSVEAASRSLPEYNEESLRALVDKIVDSQIADGLLSDAPLTFKNITDIKRVFVEKLMSVYHSRISYPDLNK